MAPVTFLLNGEPRVEEGVPPATTVLDWLRGPARLTGTKEGCAEGDCGACTIVIARPDTGRLQGHAPDWQAVNSCLLLLPQIDGCAVLTVEGLSPPEGPLHPVQQVLVDHDATQCGFCTPGFAMAMFAFSQQGEAGTDTKSDAEIHEALAGNLCRCTGYRSIVDACRSLATSTLHSEELQAAERRAAPPAAPLLSRYPRPFPAGGRGEEAPSPDDGAGGSPEPGGSHNPEAQSASFVYSHDGQRFFAPVTLDELLGLRERHPEALLLAGGTDLGLRVSKHRESLPLVISTARVEGLRVVRETGGALEIGAAATYADMLERVEARFPAFGALIRRIGSRQIRNLGTLAGNLANASPIGDTLPCLIALGAEVVLRSTRGERRMEVAGFITGYRRTALAPDEVITAIRIPFLPNGESFSAFKLSKRFDQDISTVVAAFRLRLAEGRVAEIVAAFGGMAARPSRAVNLEKALAGRRWSGDALADVDALLARDFAPLSDQRGGAAYRLRAAAGLLRRFHLETASVSPQVRLEAL